MKIRWTKITPDNVEQVYTLRDEGYPIMIACYVDGIGMTYGTPDSFGVTIGTMSKFDCYYYYILPKLHK